MSTPDTHAVQPPELRDVVEQAVAAYKAMDPVDRALHDDEQRRSFVRGQGGRDPGPGVLADEVRRLRSLLPTTPTEDTLTALISRHVYPSSSGGLYGVREAARAILGAGVALTSPRVQELEAENEELRLAICGGEDAPGHAASLPLAAILEVAAQNLRRWRAESDRALAAEAQLAALRPSLSEEEVAGLRELREFLAGSGPLDGLWFGDDAPIVRGRLHPFWWRKHLNRIDRILARTGGGEDHNSLPPTPMPTGGE